MQSAKSVLAGGDWDGVAPTGSSIVPALPCPSLALSLCLSSRPRAAAALETTCGFVSRACRGCRMCSDHREALPSVQHSALLLFGDMISRW